MTVTPEARVKGAVLDRMIVAAMATGQTYAEIGAELGYSRSAILRRAQRLDARSRVRGGHTSLTPQDLETIRQRVLAGDDFTVIARLLRRSRPTIIGAVRRHGLHMADLGQGQLDEMFARGLRTAVIAIRTGLDEDVVSERRTEWRRLKRKEAELAATQAAVPEVADEPMCKLQKALQNRPPYQDVEPADIVLEDYAWSIGARVSSARTIRLMREARAA